MFAREPERERPGICGDEMLTEADMSAPRDELALPGPLTGRHVVVVHPAWHSCGTYEVVKAQVSAYARLGAIVSTVACSNDPFFISPRSRKRRAYFAATPELDGTGRAFAGVPLHRLASPTFLAKTLWPYLLGDQAAIRVGTAAASIMGGGMAQSRIDFVHCNHFFCMPVAQALAPGAPLIVETHDVQASQFVLINERRHFLPKRFDHAAMLRRELVWLAQADLLVHLNQDEHDFFASCLPQKRHRLIYPAIAPAAAATGARFLFVASDNAANLKDVLWLLEHVLPLTGAIDLDIVGTVNRAVAKARPDLFAKHRSLFCGFVDDVAARYAGTGTVLLPSTVGHGLSIKAVQALSSGAHIIATSQAFRGMMTVYRDFDAISVVDDAASFAAAIISRAKIPNAPQTSVLRRIAYEKHFGAEAYARKLEQAACAVPER